MYGSGIPDLAKAYQEELLREAELGYLGTSAKRPDRQLRARLMARVGRALISIGAKLVQRYGPVLTGSSCFCHDMTHQVPG